MSQSFGYDNVTASDVTSLRKALLQDYDPYLRPRKRQSDPVIINASFGSRRFNDISEKDGKVSLLGYLIVSWNDEFLVWDKSNHSNIEDIVVKPNDVWWPTLALANPIGDFETLRNHYGIFRVQSTGAISWIPGGLFSVTCNMKLQKYPFDTQTCDLVFVVLGYSPDDVIFRVNPNVLEVQGTTEWDVINTQISPISEERAGLTVRFTLQRKPYFVVLTVITPLSLLSCLNLFVFLIPVESGEKLSFGMTTFLAYSIYLSSLGDSLPDDATNSPCMTVYVEVLMFLSVVIMAVIIVQTRCFYYHGYHLLTCSYGRTENETKKDNILLSAESSEQSRGKTSAQTDRILFVCFFFILALISLYFFGEMTF
jgi:hypothetical protein